MAETDQCGPLQNALTWACLQTVGELSDWMMTVHDHELQVNRPEALRQENGVIISPRAPAYQSLVSSTAPVIGLRLNDRQLPGC
jgi:hypothetical protein